MYGNSGADRYLEFQYHFTGGFYTLLFQAIGQADDQNLERLAKGFPEEVEAHVTWTVQGVGPFVQGVTKGHPLLANLLRDHGGNPAVWLASGEKLPEGYKIDQGDPWPITSTANCPECGGSVNVRLVSRRTGWPTGPGGVCGNLYHQGDAVKP